MKRTSAIGLLTVCFFCACTNAGSAPEVQSTPKQEAPSAEEPRSFAASFGSSKQSLSYRIGPFDLAAGTSPEKMREHPGEITFHVDESLWITGFTPRVEDAEGNPLPGDLIYLASVKNQSEENPLCSAESKGNTFLAATSTMKDITMPEGYGYAVLPEDKLHASVILRNATDVDYQNVYFSFTIVGEPMKTSKATQDVLPLLLDTNTCQHQPLAVEPGGYVTRKEQFVLPESGKLVAAFGLMQDRAVKVSLSTSSDDSAPIWQAEAAINASHQITHLPPFKDAAGIPLRSGDNLFLTVAYQNFSESWYNDATVSAIVYMARTGEPAAPSAAKPYSTKASPSTDVQAMLIQ